MVLYGTVLPSSPEDSAMPPPPRSGPGLVDAGAFYMKHLFRPTRPKPTDLGSRGALCFFETSISQTARSGTRSPYDFPVWTLHLEAWQDIIDVPQGWQGQDGCEVNNTLSPSALSSQLSALSLSSASLAPHLGGKFKGL